MHETTGFDDRAIVRETLGLLEEMRADPIGARLAAIELGGVDLWSAFRYELADLLYDHAWARADPAPPSARPAAAAGDPGFAGRVRRNLRRGLWGPELASSLLEPSGALDLVESAQFAWRSRREAPAHAAPVVLAGFAHRSSLMRFPTFASRGEEGPEVPFQVLLHDDNLARQRRDLRPVADRLIASESFLRRSDYRRATRRAEEVEAILASREARGTRLAPVVRELAARCLHRRRFRRLYLGAEAVGRFVRSRAIGTFVVPDERQPLARAAATLVKSLSPARVVSVPEPVDQYVRKMPLWGEVAADVVVVAGPAVERALGRAGIDQGKLRTCPFPGVEGLLETVAAARDRARDDIAPPTALYCDQPLPGSARRFAQFVAALGDPPRFRWIYRPHPRQSSPIPRRLPRGCAVDRSRPVVEAIGSAALVVTHSSMVATLAVLMERPVVLWNPEPSPTHPVLLLEGLASWARTPEELMELVGRLLDSRPDHPLRESQVRFRDGLAASCSAPELGAFLSPSRSRPSLPPP